MIRCANCYNFLYCNMRSFEKDYCNSYKQIHCRSCAKYPLCIDCESPDGTCDNCKSKLDIIYHY